MKIVSLMAGVSSRLSPLTDSYHKALIKIGPKTLVEHQLDAFKESDIKEAVFIVGHKADLIKNKLGGEYNGVKIKYIYNPYYSTKNINYSLYMARSEAGGEGFIYMEADLLFDPAILKMVVNSRFDNCLIADPGLKSTMVDTLVLGRDSKVTGLLFKEHGDLKDELKKRDDVIGELILMIKFNAGLSANLFNELGRRPFEGRSTLYSIFESCFKADEMHYIPAERHPWIEIDNHDDLRRAREEVFPKMVSQC